MTIEIKNNTVGSLFDQVCAGPRWSALVCAGPRWSALKVFYNLNVPGYMNIKKKCRKFYFATFLELTKLKKIIRGALYELIIS